MNNFKQLLNRLTVDELKKCLPFLSKTLKLTRKADMIESVYLAIPEKIKKQWMTGLHKLGYFYPQENS